MTAVVTVRLKGRTAYFGGSRALVIKAFTVAAGCPWMIDIREQVPCCSIDRADDVMVVLEHQLHARVHLVDETSLFGVPQLCNVLHGSGQLVTVPTSSDDAPQLANALDSSEPGAAS